MSKLKFVQLSGLSLFLIFISSISGFTQNEEINSEVVSFKKRELNSGIVFDVTKEREELLSDEVLFEEDRNLFNGKYRFQNLFWNLQDYKQERLNLSLELGPFGGFGDLRDSTNIEDINADQNFYGLRGSANVDYLYRYYYDNKSYTFFDVNAWGRYDVYKQNIDGTSTDSLGVVSPVDESSTEDRLRYGINAKVGWGIGRLSPMNHLMTAHYLLEKYYPGRLFSDYEIAQFAQVIAEIKNNRDYKAGRILDKEMEELADFVSKTFILASPESMSAEWQFGEFEPRFEGNKFELGPQFKYYNQEPDFLYGGFMRYNNAKYMNVKWNRNFTAALVYERYTRQDWEEIEDGISNSNKSQDWAKAEIDLGWSYYSNLKSQFDFGIRYMPGVQLSSFDDFSSISHNVIPYVAYFTQLNAKSRLKLDFAWRIADGEQFILPGPEFSLSFYRSKY